MTENEDANDLISALLIMGAGVSKDEEGNIVAAIDATVENGVVKIDEHSFINAREFRFNPVSTREIIKGLNEITLFPIDAFIDKLFELGAMVTENKDNSISVIFTKKDGIQCIDAGSIIGPEGRIYPGKYGYEIDEIKKELIIFRPL